MNATSSTGEAAKSPSETILPLGSGSEKSGAGGAQREHGAGSLDHRKNLLRVSRASGLARHGNVEAGTILYAGEGDGQLRPCRGLRNTKQLAGVGGRLGGQRRQVLAPQLRQSLGGENHPRWLVPLLAAAQRMRDEIGAIGLDEQIAPRESSPRRRGAFGISCWCRLRCRRSSTYSPRATHSAAIAASPLKACKIRRSGPRRPPRGASASARPPLRDNE